MAQIFILKCKFDQTQILMALQYTYHTLDDVIIKLYVPSNLLYIHKMLLKNWAKHRVFSHFLGG